MGARLRGTDDAAPPTAMTLLPPVPLQRGRHAAGG
jgi:hypothetical protein